MRRAVCRGRTDELVLILVEPNEKIHHGTVGEEALYIFMAFDINHAFGLDGTEVLLWDGR